MMKKHFPVITEQDKDVVFIVECPLFDGCRSYGYTIDEAMQNIREAIEACLEGEEQEKNANSFIGIRDMELIVS